MASLLKTSLILSPCCERSADAIIVRISLPDVKRGDVTLDVTATQLKVGAPKHRLLLHLPHKVDRLQGRASWDSQKQALSVTLPIVRDEA